MQRVLAWLLAHFSFLSAWGASFHRHKTRCCLHGAASCCCNCYAIVHRGRAGRVRPGVCYKLYPRLFLEMREHEIPELQRTQLEELCLQILHMQLGGAHVALRIAAFVPSALAGVIVCRRGCVQASAHTRLHLPKPCDLTFFSFLLHHTSLPLAHCSCGSQCPVSGHGFQHGLRSTMHRLNTWKGCPPY